MKKIAVLFPAKIRREILENNTIFLAIASASDSNMEYLMLIWKQYAEPSLKVNCNLCYDRVLKNFKALQPTLIELEKEYQLLT